MNGFRKIIPEWVIHVRQRRLQNNEKCNFFHLALARVHHVSRSKGLQVDTVRTQRSRMSFYGKSFIPNLYSECGSPGRSRRLLNHAPVCLSLSASSLSQKLNKKILRLLVVHLLSLLANRGSLFSIWLLHFAFSDIRLHR